MTIRIAIAGVGKIARDQHLPSIAADPSFELAATVSRVDPKLDVPHFTSVEAMLDEGPPVDAVALCMPPQARYAAARAAIAAGLHVFLEKPPGASVAEVDALRRQSAAAGVTLFASWHSRFAAGVEPAREWLVGKAIRAVAISWREDVRVWHPGQDWIWEPGGLGVFDPGINALSIVTRLLPEPLFVCTATLSVPENRAAPIAADLTMTTVSGIAVSADFDFRQTGPQSWDIVVDTDAGRCTLAHGGAVLTLPGRGCDYAPDREYSGLYARFAALVAGGASEVDTAPLQLVADAFLCGRALAVEPFVD
ncbi:MULTISPECIES: Gfo/Idh/MocA family protein [unclassified Sphingomonas]|uniref:Gfo/Idh/MocA family protein n=1 Tax=unclassified Sphingomonas TaxID=196159 RepID=UPI000830A6EF|nr:MULTISPECIES: Gfo/Idh/MocA family oxidoreductase [unclassified Sphingomonas]